MRCELSRALAAASSLSAWLITTTEYLELLGGCLPGQKRTGEETVSSDSLSGPRGGEGRCQDVLRAGGWGQSGQTASAHSQPCRRKGSRVPRGAWPPALAPSPHRMDPTAYAELLKESGNQVLKNGNFSLAIRKYDEAIQILLQLYQWG